MKDLRLAFIGFGNSGRALARLLLDKKDDFLRITGFSPKVTAIATATRGNLVCSGGIDIVKALKDIENIGRFDENVEAYSTMTVSEIIEEADYDVMIEISPLNIFTGQPASDNIKAALSRGKHVITANKGPIAWHFKELNQTAASKNAVFLYETTVMDGTPVFNFFEETLPGCSILEISGILNSSTNFILCEMEKGISFEAAVKEGQRRGFVEADPSLDIDGWDSAAKVAAITNVLMNADITPIDVKRTGIRDITADDILKAKKDCKRIKLVCRAQRNGDRLTSSVCTEWVEMESALSNITGTSSVLTLKTDLMGEITIIEHDPEIEQTAYGLYSDLIRLSRKAER